MSGVSAATLLTGTGPSYHCGTPRIKGYLSESSILRARNNLSMRQKMKELNGWNNMYR